jgi:hypothetical protein
VGASTLKLRSIESDADCASESCVGVYVRSRRVTSTIDACRIRRHALPADARAIFRGKIFVQTRRTVRAARGFVEVLDVIGQCCVVYCSTRGRTTDVRVEAVGGDTQQLAQSFGPGGRPGALSRIGILRRNRLGLPREPGSGFSQDLPLDLQLLGFTAQLAPAVRAPPS